MTKLAWIAVNFTCCAVMGLAAQEQFHFGIRGDGWWHWLEFGFFAYAAVYYVATGLNNFRDWWTNGV